MQKIKNALNKYYTPTPVKWRKVGDAILLVGTIISTTLLSEYEKAKELFQVQDLRHLLIVAILLTVLGKVLTNFAFKDEVLVNQEENQLPSE
jgi:hypothetical protein